MKRGVPITFDSLNALIGGDTAETNEGKQKIGSSINKIRLYKTIALSKHLSQLELPIADIKGIKHAQLIHM